MYILKTRWHLMKMFNHDINMSEHITHVVTVESLHTNATTLKLIGEAPTSIVKYIRITEESYLYLLMRGVVITEASTRNSLHDIAKYATVVQITRERGQTVMYALTSIAYDNLAYSHTVTVTATNNTIAEFRQLYSVPVPKTSMLVLYRLTREQAVILRMIGFTVHASIRLALDLYGTDIHNDYVDITVRRHFHSKML